MSGTKRDHDGNERRPTAAASAAPKPRQAHQDGPPGRFQEMFMGFRNELDEHHDRRERIIKVSRDVTALSKKIIFSLQRVKQLNKEFPANIQKDIDTRLTEITKLLSSIAPDLASINRYRYAHSLRGLEELVEALSFMHYLRHQTLITLSTAQSSLPSGFTLRPQDYLYGVFDLFGEMMRFATVTAGLNGCLAGNGERDILGDIHELSCSFEMLPEVPGKDYRQKMEAMTQSVKKVEKLGYGIVVRGSERPKGWLPDMADDARESSPGRG